MSYRFNPIEFELLENYIESSVDVVGIVKAATEPRVHQLKTGAAERRELILINKNLKELRAVLVRFI